MARVETSFLNVTLKVLHFQLAPPTRPRSVIFTAVVPRELIGVKGGGLQDLWSLGLIFGGTWVELHSAAQGSPSTLSRVIRGCCQPLLLCPQHNFVLFCLREDLAV